MCQGLLQTSTEVNQQNLLLPSWTLHSREPQDFCASKILHCDTLTQGRHTSKLQKEQKKYIFQSYGNGRSKEKLTLLGSSKRTYASWICRVVLVSEPQFRRMKHTPRNHRVPKMFLPGPPVPCCPLGSLPHLCWHQGFCLWFLHLSFLPSLQSLAHTTPSRQYPSHSEASVMNKFFSKFNTKNCFNDLNPSWTGLSCQITLTCSKGINHSFCFLRIYYHLEVCLAYGDDYTRSEWMNDWWLYCQPFPIWCSPRRDVNAPPGKGHSQDHGCGEHSAPELMATNRFFWRELQRGSKTGLAHRSQPLTCSQLLRQQSARMSLSAEPWG